MVPFACPFVAFVSTPSSLTKAGLKCGDILGSLVPPDVWLTTFSWSRSGVTDLGDDLPVSAGLAERYGLGPIRLNTTGKNTRPWKRPNNTTKKKICRKELMII